MIGLELISYIFKQKQQLPKTITTLLFLREAKEKPNYC